jgi:hypothetical protein
MNDRYAIVAFTLVVGCSSTTKTLTAPASPTRAFPVPWRDAPLARVQPRPPSRGPEPAPATPAAEARVEPKVPHDPDRFAFVVGVARYRSDIPASIGSDGDARRFARFAEEYLGVPRRNIALRLDQDATKSSLEAYVDEWLPKNLSARSRLFVYFAGHGAPDPETGDAYLVPWDADPSFIKSQGIKVKPLLARVEKLPGTDKIVFFDSCFSGSGGRSVMAKGVRPLVPVDKAFAGAPSAGMVVFAAAGADETTGTTQDGAAGLFSHFVMQGLSGQGDADHDGHITVAELQQYVERQVADEAARQNRRQKPVLATDAANREIRLR